MEIVILSNLIDFEESRLLKNNEHDGDWFHRRSTNQPNIVDINLKVFTRSHFTYILFVAAETGLPLAHSSSTSVCYLGFSSGFYCTWSLRRHFSSAPRVVLSPPGMILLYSTRLSFYEPFHLGAKPTIMVCI